MLKFTSNFLLKRPQYWQQYGYVLTYQAYRHYHPAFKKGIDDDPDFAEDTKPMNYYREFYRVDFSPTIAIGNGGAVWAAVYEVIHNKPVGGRWHRQKVEDTINGMRKYNKKQAKKNLATLESEQRFLEFLEATQAFFTFYNAEFSFETALKVAKTYFMSSHARDDAEQFERTTRKIFKDKYG
ncbi:MAG: hypothetical protein ACPGOV_00115 [Magnetovibrionaceae bacterium]